MDSMYVAFGLFVLFAIGAAVWTIVENRKEPK